ncbi:hypothetical protein R0J90_18345, partial [Micrococcus sp. SIMBA_144]
VEGEDESAEVNADTEAGVMNETTYSEEDDSFTSKTEAGASQDVNAAVEGEDESAAVSADTEAGVMNETTYSEEDDSFTSKTEAGAS